MIQTHEQHDREFPAQRSRFLSALKFRLVHASLTLARTTALRVVINATGCPPPVSNRTRTRTPPQAQVSLLIASAIAHVTRHPAFQLIGAGGDS